MIKCILILVLKYFKQWRFLSSTVTIEVKLFAAAIHNSHCVNSFYSWCYRTEYMNFEICVSISVPRSLSDYLLCAKYRFSSSVLFHQQHLALCHLLMLLLQACSFSHLLDITFPSPTLQHYNYHFILKTAYARHTFQWNLCRPLYLKLQYSSSQCFQFY